VRMAVKSLLLERHGQTSAVVLSLFRVVLSLSIVKPKKVQYKASAPAIGARTVSVSHLRVQKRWLRRSFCRGDLSIERSAEGTSGPCSVHHCRHCRTPGI
jgi:hypothetical protein